MTAAERLAAIRDRHLYDVDLGRWDEDEVGMLDALDAVLDLHRQMGGVPDLLDYCEADGSTWPCPTVAAITDALGGES